MVGLTKTEKAYQAIQGAIVTGEFAPGDKLTVRVLQSRLSISPTPIREALRMLQADGAVQNHPHQGMVVASFSAAEVEEVYRIREVVEPLAAEFAATSWSGDDLNELQQLHTDLRLAIENNNHDLAAETNSAWHDAVTDLSGSRIVRDFCSRLRLALPLRQLWLPAGGLLSWREHATIMTAIQQRDSVQASHQMRQHLDRGRLQAAERFRR